MWGRVVRGYRAANLRIHAAIRGEFDLNDAEIETLLTLFRLPEHKARHNKLAGVAGFTAGGFTKIADKLADRGLAAREACSVDRRVSYLRLTPEGAEVACELVRLAAEANRVHFIEVLGEDRATLVSEAFGALYQANHSASK